MGVGWFLLWARGAFAKVSLEVALIQGAGGFGFFATTGM